jgi:hypothetical protein
MAINWTPKAPGSVYRYTWTPPLADGDSVVSYSIGVADAVIDYDALEADQIVLYVSGGTAGTTATFTLQALTADGETLTETGYLPIISSDATGMTVRDTVSFALRKIYGLGADAPAEASDDAVERLSDMLLLWRRTGADVGATFPLEAATVIYCKPEYQSAIKNNLAVQVADHYNRVLTPSVVQSAVRGLQFIKQDRLPDERTGADYF